MPHQISPYRERPDDIGLALSGGGFRATLFHLGSVWRLNELALLGSIDRVSSVSGGSILAGLMAVRWSRLNFQEEVATNFECEIAQPIWDFCSRRIDTQAALLSLLLHRSALPRFYRKYLVGEHKLQDLPDSPEFVFNAAHLETGRNWTFSKDAMRTYRLGIVERPDVSLAIAIAASSAFPPVFSPVVLKLDPDSFRKSEYSDLFERDDLKRKVSLTDGGLYDNLGVHSLRKFGTILVSDASGPLDAKARSSLVGALVNRSLRPILIAVEQTRALRRQDVVGKLKSQGKSGALWSVGTKIQNYPANTPFEIAEGWRSNLKSTRTRLNSFSDEEKARMVNWGYLQCDLSIRSHFRREAVPPSSLPYPEYSFENHPDYQRR